MRKIHPVYYPGDTKTVKKFLWFPMTLQNETRWLEKAEIVYIVDLELLYDYAISWSWKPFRFADQPEPENHHRYLDKYKNKKCIPH